MRYLRLRRKHVSWVTILLVIVIVVAQYYGWFDALDQGFETRQPGLYEVVEFYDGDTIAVDMNGTVEKIRFIGVDTPETHDPRKPVQCGGPEASAYTKQTIGDQRVRLGSDSLSSNRDRYDRLLRYVYLPDGTLMNEKLIQTGHGFAYTYFPFTKSKQFTTDQQAAIKAKKGLWSYCKPVPNEYGGYTSNALT